MIWETGVQSQVESYRRLKKWNLMLPCLALSIVRLGSRVKWRNPGKGVASSPTPRCSSYWKGSLGSPLTNVANLTIIVCKQMIPSLLNRIWHKITYKGWYAIKPIQLNNIYLCIFYFSVYRWWDIHSHTHTHTHICKSIYFSGLPAGTGK